MKSKFITTFLGIDEENESIDSSVVMLSMLTSWIASNEPPIKEAEEAYGAFFYIAERLADAKLGDDFEEIQITEHVKTKNPFKKPYDIVYKITSQNSDITVEVFNYMKQNKGFVLKTTFDYKLRNLINFVSGAWPNNLIFKLTQSYQGLNRETGEIEGDELPYTEYLIRLNENFKEIDVEREDYNFYRSSFGNMFSNPDKTYNYDRMIEGTVAKELLEELKYKLTEKDNDLN